MVGIKHGARKTQKEAIRLLSPPNSLSCRKVSKLNKIPYRTLARWKVHFKLFGEVPSVSRMRRRKAGRHRKYNKLVTHEIIRCLQQLIRESPQIYLDEFSDKIMERTGFRLHTTCVFKLLKVLGWSLKKMFADAKERNDIEIAAHHVLLFELTNDPSQFIFVDESAKDRNTSRRQRAWQRKGLQRAINRNFTDRYDFRYTLIAPTDINGFVPGACELVRRKRNSADPDPDSGIVDGEPFEHWVRFNLVPTLGNYFHGIHSSNGQCFYAFFP